jgi:hypothetical protein
LRAVLAAERDPGHPLLNRLPVPLAMVLPEGCA